MHAPPIAWWLRLEVTLPHPLLPGPSVSGSRQSRSGVSCRCGLVLGEAAQHRPFIQFLLPHAHRGVGDVREPIHKLHVLRVADVHRGARVRRAVGELVGHIGGLVGWRHYRDASRASARECQSLEVGGDAGQGVGVAIGEDGAESIEYCEVVRESMEGGPQGRQKHAQCNGTA